MVRACPAASMAHLLGQAPQAGSTPTVAPPTHPFPAPPSRRSEPAFMEALQRRMEGVVLGLPSGSYAQRVQAEYLKELEERAKGVFAELAEAP